MGSAKIGAPSLDLFTQITSYNDELFKTGLGQAIDDMRQERSPGDRQKRLWGVRSQRAKASTPSCRHQERRTDSHVRQHSSVPDALLARPNFLG